jgi:arginyl-tRNA synthetase
MSKRKGTIIKLSDLLEEVGKDAARFYYILRRNSSHLDFDVDLAKAKSMDNPMYYIQYAHARISSIIAKYEGGIDTDSLGALHEPGEFALVNELLALKTAVQVSAAQREPYVMIDYLKSLAASFHKFYESHRVLDPQKPDVTRARVALIKAAQTTIAVGLRVLGVSAPEKM